MELPEWGLLFQGCRGEKKGIFLSVNVPHFISRTQSPNFGLKLNLFNCQLTARSTRCDDTTGEVGFFAVLHEIPPPSFLNFDFR